MNYPINFIKWLNPISFMNDSTNLIKIEYLAVDSLSCNTDFSKIEKSSQVNKCIKQTQTTDKKIIRKSYRNMPVTIQNKNFKNIPNEDRKY